jgi:ABC-2 type transport system permease protein
VCILFILMFSMLGGLWMPTFLLPPWVQELSWCLPTTWAMCGLDGVTWMGSPIDRVLPSCAAVLGFGAAAIGLAWFRFTRMERRSRRGESG